MFWESELSYDSRHDLPFPQTLSFTVKPNQADNVEHQTNSCFTFADVIDSVSHVVLFFFSLKLLSVMFLLPVDDCEALMTGVAAADPWPSVCASSCTYPPCVIFPLLSEITENIDFHIFQYYPSNKGADEMASGCKASDEWEPAERKCFPENKAGL